MGVYDNISMSKFPKQGSFAGKRVKVLFHYNTDEFVLGRFVRDDSEARTLGEHKAEPIGIIALDDGRYVLATECQFGLIDDDDIDNPESLAADLADSPYNGIEKTCRIAINGLNWYQIDLASLSGEIPTSIEAYEKQLAEENAAYIELAKRYGGEDIYGEREWDTGEFYGTGLVMPRDFDPKTQSKVRGPDGRFTENRFRYKLGEVNNETRYIGIPQFAMRREFKSAVEAIEDNMIISRRNYGRYIACVRAGIFEDYDSEDTDVISLGEKVWVGIPEDYDVKSNHLIPVPYSEVVIAQEQEFSKEVKTDA